MEQKRFLQILKKYRSGQASAEESKMIDAWYQAMGEQSDTLSTIEEEELAKDYWTSINNRIVESQTQRPHLRSRKINKTKFIIYATGIAASILIAIVSFVYVGNSSDSQIGGVKVNDDGTLPVHWEQITNPGNSARQFTLSDGSNVTLEPQSIIKFSSHFNDSVRAIYLEGEGFFEVAHNAQKPFLVYANGLTTKVLGTSFKVKAFKEDKNVTVSVVTGRVYVYTDPPYNQPNKKSEVILTPNQQIIYDTKQEKISRGIVEMPQPIIEPEEIKRIRFEGAPVTEIFEAIEKIYGVDIVFDEAVYSACTLTTSVSDGDLFNRLDIITRAIGAEYRLKENMIVVTGSACE